MPAPRTVKLVVSRYGPGIVPVWSRGRVITADNCVSQRIKGQCSRTIPLAVLRLGAVQGRSPALPFILSLSIGKVILYYPNFQIILEKFLIPVQEYFRIQFLR